MFGIEQKIMESVQDRLSITYDFDKKNVAFRVLTKFDGIKVNEETIDLEPIIGVIADEVIKRIRKGSFKGKI